MSKPRAIPWKWWIRSEPETHSPPRSCTGSARTGPCTEIAAFANRVAALVASRHGAIPDWASEETVAGPCRNEVQLIAYVDRLSGGGFRELQDLLDGPFQSLFGGVHLLPVLLADRRRRCRLRPDRSHASRFPARLMGRCARAGRRPRSDGRLDRQPCLNPLAAIRGFPQTRRYFALRGLFLTYGRVFPNGASRGRTCSRSIVHAPAFRLRRCAWTTAPNVCCGPHSHRSRSTSTSASPAGRAYLEQILREFQAAGIRAIRLDAAGYAIKKPGTSCFMIPETFDFIAELTAQAHALGIEVLVEIHAHYQDQIEIARQVDWVYDFALPPLVLHALYHAQRRSPQAVADDQPAELRHGARHARRNRRDRCGPGSRRPADSSGIVDFRGDRQPGRDDSSHEARARAARRPEPPRTTWTCIRSIALTTMLSAGAMKST